MKTATIATTLVCFIGLETVLLAFGHRFRLNPQAWGVLSTLFALPLSFWYATQIEKRRK